MLSLNQGLSSSVPCAPEDAAYHECLMAGYTSEEARILINNLDQLTEDSTDQSHMVENFWVEVGFPKGTRWWETEKESEGSMPDHCQCVPSTSSSSDKLVKQPIKAEQFRSANKPLSKKGFVVRPWRGPLPKSRPSEITLEAFFSKEK